tara:strand:+ start:112 stop:1734 length:1623 start_codon:yes stop_codon:yes gene_type:complete
MAIRIERGEIQAPTIRTGDSQLTKTRRFARMDQKSPADVLSDAVQIYTNHRKELDQVNRLNVINLEEGKLQDNLLKLNQKIDQEYKIGNISDEQLNLIYDQEAQKTIKFYEKNLDPQTFSMFKGTIYKNFTNAKREGLRAKDNAVIATADLTYRDKKLRILDSFSKLDPVGMDLNFYNVKRKEYEQNVTNISRVRKVDVDQELTEFDFIYLRRAAEGLIDVPAEGKTSQYYFDLANKLRNDPPKNLGGINLTERYKNSIIKDIEETKNTIKQVELEKKERINTPIFEDIKKKQSTGTLTYQDIADAKQKGDASLEFLTEIDGYQKRMEESFQGIDKDSDPVLYKEIQVLIDKADVITINEPFLTNQETQYNKTATEEQQLQPLSLVDRFNEPITSRQSLDEKTYNFFKPQLKEQKNELDRLFESRFKQEIARIRKEIEPRFILNDRIMAEFDRKVTADLYQFAREKFYKDKIDIDTLFNLDSKIGIFYKYYEDNKTQGKKFQLTEKEQFNLQMDGRTPQQLEQDKVQPLEPIDNFYEKLE